MDVSSYAFPGELSVSFLLALLAVTLTANFLARAGFPIASIEGRYSCIDGLRGLCAIAVLFHHFSIWLMVSSGHLWQAPPLNVLNQLGAGAVGIFFMITGLVFYPKILEGLSKTAWLTLYVRRVFRIIPMVSVSTFCVAIVAIVSGGRDFSTYQIVNLIQWISAYLEPDLFGFHDAHLINASVLWSLRFEWLFYILLLPLAAWVQERLGLTKTWILPVTLAIAGLVLSFIHYRFGFIAVFAVGMIGYEVRSQKLLRDWCCSGYATAIAFLGVIFAFCFTQFLDGRSLALLGFFMICAACGNSFCGVLNSCALRVLGEISFGVYLLHGIFLFVMFNVVDGLKLHPDTLSFLLVPVAIIVVLFASATYMVVERPANLLGGKVADFFSDYRQRRLTQMQVEVAP